MKRASAECRVQRQQRVERVDDRILYFIGDFLFLGEVSVKKNTVAAERDKKRNLSLNFYYR